MSALGPPFSLWFPAFAGMTGEKSPECRGRNLRDYGGESPFPLWFPAFAGMTGERREKGGGGVGDTTAAACAAVIGHIPDPRGEDRGTLEGSVRRHVGRETPMRTGMSKSPPGPLCWDSVVDAVICSIAAFCLSRTLGHANWAVWGLGVSRRGRGGGYRRGRRGGRPSQKTLWSLRSSLRSLRETVP